MDNTLSNQSKSCPIDQQQHSNVNCVGIGSTSLVATRKKSKKSKTK